MQAGGTVPPALGIDTPMTEALRVGLHGSGRVSAPDLSARLRALAPESTDIPHREGLIWAQPQPIIPLSLAAAPASRVEGSASPATREIAALASDVYNDIAAPPAGYRVATQSDLARLGIRQNELESTSGFRARVYVTNAQGNASYVVAFRGTTSSGDWQANFRQGVGLQSDHYQKALKIAVAVGKHPDVPVMMTGHSLGGGLASAAAIASGRDASTFNAAGLSSATIANANKTRTDAGIGRATEVQAFYVRGEVLSAIQDGGDRAIGQIFGGAIGRAIVDAPSAYGTRISLAPVRPAGTPWYGDNPVARHGMNWVQSSLHGR
jgi:Protein of unknown function (DUF2974)